MIAALTLLSAPPLQAQYLRDELSDLFIFGSVQSPLTLGGTSDPSNPDSIWIHGNHFVPAAVASNGRIISFLTNSIGSNVANVPISATSGGSTFSFQGGVPVRTSTSAAMQGKRGADIGLTNTLMHGTFSPCYEPSSHERHWRDRAGNPTRTAGRNLQWV